MSKPLKYLFLNTGAVQLAGKLTLVIIGVFLARILGPVEYGKYTFILSLITIGSIPVIAGIPQLLIREVSKYRGNLEWDDVAKIHKWSGEYCIKVSLIMMPIVAITGYITFGWSNSYYLLLLFILIIPLKSMMIRDVALINAFDKPMLSQIPQSIFLPITTALGLVLLYFINTNISLMEIILVQLVAGATSLLFSSKITRALYEVTNLDNIKSSKSQKKDWHKSLLPFVLFFVISTMNSELGMLALGVFSESSSIGFFKVASQSVALMTLFLITINVVIGPKIASTYHKGNLEETQNILTKSVKISCLFSIPIALLLLFFADNIVVLLFGDEYQQAGILVSILCIGQIVNVLMGSVGLVLNMTGYEKKTLPIMFKSFLLNFFIMVVFIPIYGEIAAALSVSISIIFWNIMMAFKVYKLTKLKTWLHF